MKAVLKIWLAVVYLMFGTGLASDFVEVEYDNVYGESLTFPDTDEASINPSGHLRIKVAGEVGAIIQAILETEGGGPAEYVESAPLDGKDWISLASGDTIGAYLTLPIPDADGRYRLTVYWVDAKGNSRTVSMHNLVVDRAPPEMTGSWWFRGGLIFDGEAVVNGQKGVPLANGAVIDTAAAEELRADGIVDSLSGIESVSFFEERPEIKNNDSKDVIWRTLYDPRRDAALMWRLDQGLVEMIDGAVRRIGFTVQDRAGNKAVFAREVRFAGPCGQGGAIVEEVKTKNGDWVPVSPDRFVKQEAMGVRFRIPNAQSAQTDPGLGVSAVYPGTPATGPWPPEPMSIDALFTRYEVTSMDPIPNVYTTLRSATQLGCEGQATGDDQAPNKQARHVPAIIAVRLKNFTKEEKSWRRSPRPADGLNREPEQQDSGSALIRLDARWKPGALRVEVADQVFPQTVRIGDDACEIPAGDTGCDLGGVGSNLGDQHELEVVTKHLVVENSETGQQTDSIAITFYQDRLLPEIVEHRFVDDQQTLELVITEERPETLAVDSGIAEVWVETQGQNGHSTRLEGTVEGEKAGNYAASVNLASLPEGRYSLRGYARDLNGNISFPLILSTFEKVNGASELRLSVNGQDASTQEEVNSFDRILVTDATHGVPQDADIWFAIEGGGKNITTRVRGVRTNDGIRPGFIPLKQSLGVLNYRITAMHGNGGRGEVSRDFRYKPQPAWLEGDDVLTIPAIARATRRADGSWPLTTTPVTRAWSGGAPVRGRHDLRVALSPDATASLRIAERDLHPGETLIVRGYDFDANEQRIILPVALGEESNHRHGYVGVLSIAVALPDVPALAMPVRAYTAASLIAANWSKPAYRTGERDARLNVQALDNRLCDSGVLLVQDPLVVAQNGNTEGAGVALCAIAWDSVPAGMGSDGQTGNLAGTVSEGSGMATASYQAGFAVVEDDGESATFFPSGERVEVIAAVVAEEPSISALLPSALARSEDDWLAASGWPWDSWWEGDIRSRWLHGEQAEPPRIVANGDPLQTDAQTGSASINMAAAAVNQCFVAGRADVATDAGLCLEDRDAMPVLTVRGPAVRQSEDPVVIRGRVGIALRNATDLAAPESGYWRITVKAVLETAAGASDGGHEKHFEGQTDSGGDWSIDLGRLAPGRYQVWVAAQDVRDVQEQGCGEHLEEPITLVVRDGSAITATLLESMNESDIGARRLIRIALSTPARAVDVQAILWEERTNDAPEWREVRRDGVFWELDATDMGRRTYRVTLVNAHSGIEFTAALQEGEAPAVKRLQIETAQTPEQDQPVKFSAHNAQEEPVIVAWGAWNVESGWITELGGGTPTIEATLEEPGDWVVLAVHQDSTGRRERALQTIRLGGYGLPRLRIEGPEHAETGKTFRYRVGGIRHQEVGDGDQQWALRWTLPDEATLDGRSVDYTPRNGDRALMVTATRRSEDSVESVSVTVSPSLFSYTWPAFELRSKGKETEGGWSGVYMAITRSILGGGREGLSYQWELPQGARGSGQGNERQVQFATGVERWVMVTITDMRGNSQILHDVRKDPGAPLTLELKTHTEDAWSRVPTTAVVTLITSGLSRRERIVGTRVWVNGALASDKLADFHEIPMQRAQVLQIDAEVTTSEGRKAQGSVMLEMHDGKPPSCKLRISGDWRSTLKATADCTIARGEITGYHWLVEYGDTGEVRDFGVRSGKLALDEAHLSRGIREIRMNAIDDRGIASSEVVRAAQEVGTTERRSGKVPVFKSR